MTTSRGKTTKFWVLALALAGMGLAGSAQAVPISYTEPPDLDNNVSTPTALGALDVGVNTVTGGINCSGFDCTVGDDNDAFGVTLPAGLKITSVTLDVSNFAANNREGRAREFTAFPVDFNTGFAADGLLNLFSGDAGGPGSLVFQAFASFIQSGSASASYNYVWSITVSSVQTGQVPEPGTLMLFGAALAGLGWARRRKS